MTCRVFKYLCLLSFFTVLIICLSKLSLFTAGLHNNKMQTKAPVAEQNHMSILIDIDEHRIFLLKGGKPYKNYPCATGAMETPSPLGYYKITDKHLWGEGFGGFWMGINCPWGHFGIHGTTKPESIGYSMTHGCIRMYSDDSKDLYRLSPIGTPVLIISGCYGPFGRSFRDIGPGMYGLDVQIIQKKLRELGFYKGACDGQYDSSGFNQAYIKFQKTYGLKTTNIVTKKAAEKMGFIFMD